MKSIKSMNAMQKLGCLLSLCIITFCGYAQAVGDKLSPWQRGYLDIHHINTGCGECTYFILPDGTTMMVDAGENNPNDIRHVPAKPTSSKTPGEWIVQYVNEVAPNKQQGLDYVMLTHFHGDHIGGVLKTLNSSGKYYNTGIITVAENLRIGKLVDRDYPHYDYLCNCEEKQTKNYLDFLQNTSRTFVKEKFKPGYNDQFRLVYDSASFPTFKVQNLYSNGDLWTGEGTETRHLFPDLSMVKSFDLPEENTLSCAIRLSYGNFAYYTGGDVTGYAKPGRSAFHDVETHMAPITGDIDVCVVNHHGYNNATNDLFISTLKPRVFVMLASDALHPNHSTLYRMLSTRLYPEKRDVFATNLHNSAEIVIGDLTEEMKSHQGHIVVRALLGGSQYYVYVLDDSNTDYKIKNIFGPYGSKQKDWAKEETTAVSKEEEAAEPLHVYPNPTTEQLTVVYDKGEMKSIELYNLAGELLHTYAVNAASTTLSTSNLAAGIYILRVGQSRVKFVKE
jgi:beta-lactamase superfamily II metal-dependent hydrolase